MQIFHSFLSLSYVILNAFLSKYCNINLFFLSSSFAHELVSKSIFKYVYNTVFFGIILDIIDLVTVPYCSSCCFFVKSSILYIIRLLLYYYYIIIIILLLCHLEYPLFVN